MDLFNFEWNNLKSNGVPLFQTEQLQSSRVVKITIQWTARHNFSIVSDHDGCPNEAEIVEVKFFSRLKPIATTHAFASALGKIVAYSAP